MQEPVKIEVGCGSDPKPGYLHCDLRPLPHVEHVCPAWAVPFARQSVDEIYSRHLLEHLTLAEARRTLRHWYAVLKPGGKLDLCVPDLAKHIAQLSQPGTSPYLQRSVPNSLHALAGFYGWQEHERDFHRWGYTFDSLQAILTETGFASVRRIEDDSRAGPLNLRVLAVKGDGSSPEQLDPEAGRYTTLRRFWNGAVARLARLLSLSPRLP